MKPNHSNSDNLKEQISEILGEYVMYSQNDPGCKNVDKKLLAWRDKAVKEARIEILADLGVTCMLEPDYVRSRIKELE